MTGGVAQFMRVMESIPTDAPIADRPACPFCDEQELQCLCIRVAKQGIVPRMVARWEIPDAWFETGPANPTLNKGDM